MAADRAPPILSLCIDPSLLPSHPFIYIAGECPRRSIGQLYFASFEFMTEDLKSIGNSSLKPAIYIAVVGGTTVSETQRQI